MITAPNSLIPRANIITKPDTTYTVKSVTLKNINDEKAYDLNDRSVYVLAIPSSGQSSKNVNLQNGLTGYSILGPNGLIFSNESVFSKDYWSSAIKKPLVPTILGFTLMFIVIGGALLVKRFK